MIALFSYFINLAVLTALIEPLLIVFWMNGWSLADLLLQPGWNAVYAAVNQISSLLVWPIWITSLTLLYFDTRVRREGYDIELMTVSLPSPPYSYAGGTLVFRPAVPQWSTAPAALPPRQYMQTGPLGLGGYPVTSPAIATPRLSATPPVSVNPPASVNPSEMVNPPVDIDPPVAANPPGIVEGPAAAKGPVRCAVCGLVAIEGAKYCISCGDLLQTEESNQIVGPG
jgi:hypothetical protein